MDARMTGTLIAATRQEKEWTQKELAEALHVSPAAVSKWERGLSFPDVTLLEPLGAALGLTAAELLAGERDVPAKEESLRSLLTLAGQQLRAQAKRWRRAMAVLLCALAVFGGVFWCWKSDCFPQSETVLMPRALPEESLWWAGELTGSSVLLFDLTTADDFRDMALQLEYRTEQGLEQSWELYATHTAGHGWERQERLGIALDFATDGSGGLDYQVLLTHGSYRGHAEGIPLGEGVGLSAAALSQRTRADRADGTVLWCGALAPEGTSPADGAEWFDDQQTAQMQSGEAFLVLRLLCEYET